jgi:hypothetical protein
VKQIAGKSVREVYHGSRQALLDEPLAESETRLGIEVLSCQSVLLACCSLALLHEPQTQFRFPEPATHIEEISLARTRSKDGAPGRNFAHDCYIDKNFASPGGVAACQRAMELARSAPQPREEQIQPAAGMCVGQSQA